MKTADGALVQTVLLSLWLGSAVLFATVVTPAAFAVLPSRALAGSIVGRVLPMIFYSGIVVGLVVMVLERTGTLRESVTARAAAGLGVAVSCAIAQFFIAPRIERVRASIAGTVDALSPDDVRRIAFGRLHGESVVSLGVAVIAALVALILAIRAQRTGS